MLQDTGKRVIVEDFGNAVQQVEGIPIVTAELLMTVPLHITHASLHFMRPC